MMTEYRPRMVSLGNGTFVNPDYVVMVARVEHNNPYNSLRAQITLVTGQTITIDGLAEQVRTILARLDDRQ